VSAIINLFHSLQTSTYSKPSISNHVNSGYSPSKLQWKASGDLTVQFNSTGNFCIKVRRSSRRNLTHKCKYK